LSSSLLPDVVTYVNRTVLIKYCGIVTAHCSSVCVLDGMYMYSGM